jgi:hypothetical protein
MSGASWIIWITSGTAYLALIVLVVVCVLAISIVHNRLEEMLFVEKQRQRNFERTAMLGRGGINSQTAGTDSSWAENFRILLEEANKLNATVYDLTYKQLYGDKDARDNRKRWADRFHANSDTTNIMIIGMCACPIALCAARLLATATARSQNKLTFIDLFASVTILDVFLGMLTGLLATFVMKSGSNILSKTSLSTVDVSNPYGVAFVAGIAGLFMDKFYSWLEPLLTTGK